MKKLLAYLVANSRLLVAALFVMAWLLIASGQTPQIFDKHVGGDVPIDEQRSNATSGRSGTSALPEDRVIKHGLLAPSKEDRTALAAFLHLPNTGLIRLWPLERVTYQPGAYYSFANVTHFSRYGSDIGLKGGQLSASFAGLGYGLLANLGDLPLEEVALSNPRTRFIADYRPAVTFLEARAEILRFQNAATIDGIRYGDRLPVEANSTYLLRSINYGKLVFGSSTTVRPVDGPRRTDVLVTFRVIRRDSDGSVTIAWKLLKKYSEPKIE